MNDPFSSARLKIDRAKHHIDELERGVLRFDSKNSYEIIVEVDAEPGYKAYKFRLREPAPLNEFAVILGDAVHNLRAALDHIVYACALLNGHVDPKIGTCKFPFGKDAKTFGNAVDGCTSVPKEIRTVLRTFQAFKDGHLALWALNQMCNRDKHALITPVLMGFNTINVKVTNDAEIESARNPWWDDAKNEIELFRTKDDPQYQFTISLDIALDRPEGIGGHRVTAMLGGFRAVVEAILGTVETEAKRIGLIV